MLRAWTSMSPEEQRIKVAELVGWRNIHHGIVQTQTGDEYSDWLGQSPDGTMATSSYGDIAQIAEDSREYIYRLPDYLNDLNAIHDAESTLGCPQTLKSVLYQRFLKTRYGEEYWGLVGAAERAEAFVFTMEYGNVK
jgi:hypothetical protein